MSLTLQMTPVGFEPTQLALVELESTPLDHSGKVSWQHGPAELCNACEEVFDALPLMFAQPFTMSMHTQYVTMVPRGLEPRTLRLLAVRSNQLSYETKC